MLETASLASLRENANEIIVLSSDAGDNSSIQINHAEFLFTADYARVGADLQINGEDGRVVFIENYFLSDVPADLVGPLGGVLRGPVVVTLAGPESAGQYAQAGQAPDGSVAIGQLESLVGSASVQRTDGTVEQLTIDSKVFQNDVVITDAGSTLSITFLDGTIFALSENSRMVLSELVYAPDGNSNSSVFDLVEGSFVFIAGEVAKTGEMAVKTPVATMGIRGTTVKVDIETRDGVTRVEVSLNTDPNGDIGNFTITGLNGEIIADVQTTDTKWVIAPDGNSATEVPRTQVDFGNDQILLNQAVNDYNQAQDRVARGGNFVETDSSGDDPTPDQNNDSNDGPEDGVNDGDVETDIDEEAPGDQGSLDGSGLETEVVTDTTLNRTDDGTQFIPDLESDITIGSLGGGGGDVIGDVVSLSDVGEGTTGSLAPDQLDDIADLGDADLDDTLSGGVATPAAGPGVLLPVLSGPINEDGSVVLNGFAFSSPSNANLSVALTVGSTITLATGYTVVIDTVNSIETPPGSGQYDYLVISGSAQEINDALNGATYTASPNDDDGGFVIVEAAETGGGSTTTARLEIEITPAEDDPVATADAIARVEDAPIFVGNLLLNDFDPDTGDTFEVASVFEDTGFSTPLPVNFDETITLSNGATINFSRTGEYTFTPGSQFQTLNTGDTEIYSFEYTIQDSTGRTSSSSLDITVTGSNDDPVISGNLTEVVSRGQTIVLDSTDLSVTDVDNAVNDKSFTITNSLLSGDVFVGGIQANSFTYQQLLDGEVSYVHDGSFTPTELIQLTYSDGSGGTDNASIVLAVDLVNNTPTNTLPSSVTLNEDIQTTISGLSISDSDASPLDVFTIELSVDNGIISLATGLPSGIPNANIINNGTGSISATGTIDQINSTFGNIEGLTYTGNQNFNGTDTLTITTTDGSGGTDTDSLTITVNSINDVPSDFDNEAGSTAIVERADGETDAGGNDIENTGVIRERMLGVAFDDVDTDGTPPTFSVVATGAPTGFESLLRFSFTFDDNGGSRDRASVFAEIDAVELDGLSAGETISMSYELIVTDSQGGVSASGDTSTQFTVVLTGTNDAPTLNLAPSNVGTNEDSAGVAIDVQNLIDTSIDVDGDTLSATILGATNGLLDFAVGGGVSFIPDADFSGIAEVTYRIEDGNGGSFTETLDIAVNAVNDSAVLSGDLAIQVDVGSSIVITTDDLNATDIDDAASDLTFTVTAAPSFGTLFVNGATAPTFTVQDVIDGLVVYNQNGGVSPSDSLNFSLADGGEDGATASTGTLNITIGELNQAPVNTVPGAQNVAEDIGISITGISVNDPDVGTGALQVSLIVTNGTITVLDTVVSGVSASQISGNGTNTVVLVASQGAINTTLAALDGVIYLGDLNFNGIDTLQVETNDNGNTGVGGAQTDTDTITINVSATNDAPTIVVPATQTVQEDSTVSIAGISIADVDAGTANVQVLLSASDGEISILDTVSGGLNASQITNNASGSVTLTATLDAINTTLAATGGVTYSGNANFSGTELLTVSVTDLGNTGSGIIGTASSQINISVTATNDDPVITAPAAVTTNEDVPINITAISVSDVDANGADITVTLSVLTGDIDVANNIVGGLIAGQIFGSGTDNVTLTGTVAEINTTITATNGLIYTGNSNAFGPIDLTVTVNDGGNTGAGGGGNIVETVTINRTSQNDAPVNSLPISFNAVEDTPLVLSGITVSDIDAFGNNISVTLTVTDGTLDVDATVSGGVTTISNNGTASVVITGSQLEINTTFGSTNGLTFTPNANFSGNATIQVTSDDLGSSGEGGAQSSTDSTTIAVAADNDAPVISGTANIRTDFTENDPATVVNNTITLSDVDGGINGAANLASATVQITTNYMISEDVLSLDAGLFAGIDSAVFDAASGTLTLTGTGSVAQFQAALRAVVYENASDNASDLVRTVEFAIDDGSASNGTSTTYTSEINPTSVNDAPVNTVPGAQSVQEDGSISISGISVADADASTSNISVTLSVANGSITLLDNVSGGLIPTQISNNASGSVSLTGTISQINATLSATAGVLYAGNADFFGTDVLTVTTNDLGNTGSGTALNDVDTININVVAENDAPDIAGTANVRTEFTENDPSTIVNSTITLSDIDGGTNGAANLATATVQITANYVQGEDVLSLDAGLFAGISSATFDAVSGTLTLTGAGSIAQFQAALRGVQYENASDNPSDLLRTVEFSVDDGSVTDSGSTIYTSEVNPNSVNDGPIINGETANTTGSNLLSNGDFEAGPVGPGGVQLVTEGQTTINGWNVVDTGAGTQSVDVVNSASILTPSQGDFYIDLNGEAAGAISQTFATVAGTSYVISFIMSGDPLDGEVQKDLTVDVDGQSEAFSFTHPSGATRSDPGSVTHTLSFTATSNSTTIQFTSDDLSAGTGGGAANSGAYIDDVRVLEIANTVKSGDVLTLAGPTFIDPDAATPLITISSANGTLDFIAGTDISSLTNIFGQGTGALQFRGSVADLNAIISSSISYTTSSATSTVDTVLFTVNDLGQFGQGVAQSDNTEIFIAVTPNAPADVSNISTKLFDTFTSAQLTNSQFGEVTAINDNGTVIVGAPNYGFGSGSDNGLVIVYQPNATGGFDAPTGIATPTGGTIRFGESLDINNAGLVVIGAPRGGVSNQGRIYVHEDQGNGTYAAADFTFSGLNSSDGLGSSIAVNESGTIVAGADEATDSGFTGSGKAFVYVSNGSGYDAPIELAPPAGEAQFDNHFGSAVDINEAGVIVVGAKDGDGNVANSGTAFVFTPDGSGGYLAGVELSTSGLTPAGGAGTNNDDFGESVAINNSGIIVVGAFQEGNGEGANAGGIYIYTPDAMGSYSTPFYTFPNNADNFGRSVDINDDGVIVVGSPKSDLGAADTGSIFVYTPNGSGVYSGFIRIDAPDPEAFDNFGHNVSISSDGTIVAGAFGDDTNGIEAGSVYIYVPNGTGGYIQQVSEMSIAEGVQGTESVQTISLASYLTFSDADDTPAIDPDSIVITARADSQLQSTTPFYVDGTDVKFNSEVFDFLVNSEVGLFDIQFNVVSGTETITRVVTVRIEADNFSSSSETYGDAGSNTLTGAVGFDLIVGNDSGVENPSATDTLSGGDGDDLLIGSESKDILDGGEGDDLIYTGGNAGGVFKDEITASRGNDRIDFSGNNFGLFSLSYFSVGLSATFAIDAGNNTGSITKELGVTDEVDELINLDAVLGQTSGGLELIGSNVSDTFNIVDGGANGRITLFGGQSADNYVITDGTVTIAFDLDGAAGPTQGIFIDTTSSTAVPNNDGFGSDDTFNINSAAEVTFLGTETFDDTLITGAGDDTFALFGGNNSIDAGGGINTLRYNFSGYDTSINANLDIGTITGSYNGAVFTDTVTGILVVIGTEFNDTIGGTASTETFRGEGGNDLLTGLGGADLLSGGAGNDMIVIPDLAFAQIDGGQGTQDVVQFQNPLSPGALAIDLTSSANSKITGIEQIDLGAANSDVTLALDETDVTDFSDEFDSSFAFTNSDGIVIFGDAADAVNLNISGDDPGGSWSLASNSGGFNYYDYSDSSSVVQASVAIEDEIVNVVVA